MHYDPYESTTAKKRRIMSNIGIVVILFAMLIGLIFLIFPSSSQKKYDFDTLSTVEFTSDKFAAGENEFKSLIDTLSASSQIIVGESFKEKFPTGYSLLARDGKAYEKSFAAYPNDIADKCDAPYIEVGGGYIILAQSVVSSEKDCRDLLIVSFKATALEKENALNVTVGDYNCYTVRYNTRDANVPLKLLVGQQSAMLDMFKLRVSVIGENPTAAEYSLTLNHAFDVKRAREDLYHHIVFDPINESYGSAEIVTNEDTTDISMRQEKNALIKNENELAFEIITSEKHLNLLTDVNFKFEFEGTDKKLKITFN